jgi:long-chain acyl-CoA synthetase
VVPVLKQGKTTRMLAKEDTLPRLLLRNYQQWGDCRVALRKKHYGIWIEHTWEDCYKRTTAISLGLMSLGLDAGNGVAILADNNPEWFWSELGIQTARGIVAGLNPAGTAEETKGLLTLARAKFALAQDQEQVDKLLEVKNGVPSLQKIVYWQERGLEHYADPMLMSFGELIKLGEAYAKNHSGDLERKMQHGNGRDIAMMVFAMGAKGTLKVVPATHQFLISSAEAALVCNPVCDSDEYVSMISPAWFFEQTLGFAVCLLTGQKLNFAEKAETAMEDFREISPHVVAYPPKLWEKIAEAIQKNTNDSSWLKRTVFNRSVSVGYERVDLVAEGRRVGLPESILHRVADFAAFRPLRDKHGLDRARIIYCAGRSLSPETFRFFHAIGIHMQQIFGSTKDGILLTPPADDLRIE